MCLWLFGVLSACSVPPSSTLLPEPQSTVPTKILPAETISSILPTATVSSDTLIIHPQQIRTPLPTPYTPHLGLPLINYQGEFFATPGTYSACHSHLIDETGSDVSLDTVWQASMHPNAARNPYWQATVRSEISQFPDFRQVIEGKCAFCHDPMAATYDLSEGQPVEILDHGYMDDNNRSHNLAIEGVSCTLCHQIEPGNFGLALSFSGGYWVDLMLPIGERFTYGPFPIDEQQVTISRVGLI